MKIFLSVALLCSVLSAEDKPVTPPKSVTEVCKVFKIVSIHDGESNRRHSGTAFYVSSTRLLTAAHVLKNTVSQWIVKDGHDAKCRVVRIDYNKDVALLECDEACGAYFRLVSALRIVGFPNGGEMEEASGEIDLKRLHAHCHFVPGMSGAPLVNEYGDVEGMGVENDSDYDCKAIPASVLAEFIKSAK